MINTKLDRCVLRTTSFTAAELLEISFRYAELTKIDFTDSNLLSANLEGAKLIDIKLTNVNLQDANLEQTTWQNVVFDRCKVDGAVFSDAKGLTDEQKQWLRKNGALNVT